MPLQPPHKNADMGDEGPCGGTLDGFLPVLCKPTGPSQPCERAFDNAATRKHREALLVAAASDNLDGLTAIARQRLSQLVTRISTVFIHMPLEL